VRVRHGNSENQIRGHAARDGLPRPGGTGCPLHDEVCIGKRPDDKRRSAARRQLQRRGRIGGGGRDAHADDAIKIVGHEGRGF